MAYGVKLLVWGDYASFNRPEMKVERVSYDVMTPSAARGVLEAIYWKPEMRWVVDEIHVLNPIRFTSIRRNEVKSKIPMKAVSTAMNAGIGDLGLDISDSSNRAQRAAMILRDVKYGIAAHVDVLSHNGPETKPEAKHLDQFNRRAAKGQYHHHPYLGTREFPAHFQLVDFFPACPDEFKDEEKLGYMLHDICYIPDPKGNIIEAHKGRRLRAEPRFFNAVMRKGIISIPKIDTPEVVS
ncbi:MAG TPA: type I-C CRISPR-associated protein Cas5c [Kiritimatiellia bacterium]|nr:type I-C CRISPR-associated protein Cas5c [Kiritimatiellia bacterium]HMO98731.1 type I-C CRISPR-associated protein Cas5c [Kiritimatiellia bacterium]HMP96891.1 type I-C CRISPR-associated protein Cas5c [Kiritimatiellia bacterium]